MQAYEKPGFLLPDDSDIQTFTRQLEQHVECSLNSLFSTRSCYYDSFDWRLHQQRQQLVARSNPTSSRLSLQQVNCGPVLSSVPFDSEPAWPANLPPGDLKNEVAGALAMRVLLPQVEITSQVQMVRVLNEDMKTVARLQFETPRCKGLQNGKQADLPGRVHVQGIKGYDKETRSVEAILHKEFGLERSAACLLEESLHAIDCQPGNYNSKIKVKLSPEMTTRMAVRQIFMDLLNTLEANIEGTKEALDSEFLHDLRVATRRTRSALSQIKKVIPADVLEDYKERFAWLGSVTGPSRDMDVFLLELPHYRDSLPTALGDALEPLHAYLLNEQKNAHSALKRKLNSPHFRTLLKDWHEYLESSISTESADRATVPEAVENADRRVEEVASERIWKMHRRVLKEGRAITWDSPADDLHELRKSCKKLRYLIEFFASLYPTKEIKPLIKFLKRLLDNLGQFQDLEVQAAKLSHFAEDMLAKGSVPIETLMAMGALVGDLLRKQQLAHDEFSERFQQFDCAENLSAYRRLFKHAREQK